MLWTRPGEQEVVQIENLQYILWLYLCEGYHNEKEHLRENYFKNWEELKWERDSFLDEIT